MNEFNVMVNGPKHEEAFSTDTTLDDALKSAERAKVAGYTPLRIHERKGCTLIAIHELPQSALITYEYLGITFQMPETADYITVATEAVRRAFPRNRRAYPVRVPEKDGGGFRVYEPAQGGQVQRKLHGAEGIVGRREDGTLFWPEH